jgi:purine-cytosine permease-like protein
MLGLLTVTGLNFYGASLTLLCVVDSFKPLRSTSVKRIASLAAVGLAATTIAMFSSGNFVARFGDLLAVLLYLFTPWTAINLIDFYVVRKAHYSVREIFNPNGMYGRWNWRGLTAYGIGFAAMIPFLSPGPWAAPTSPWWSGCRPRPWSICWCAVRWMSRRIGGWRSRPIWGSIRMETLYKPYNIT